MSTHLSWDLVLPLFLWRCHTHPRTTPTSITARQAPTFPNESVCSFLGSELERVFLGQVHSRIVVVRGVEGGVVELGSVLGSWWVCPVLMSHTHSEAISVG